MKYNFQTMKGDTKTTSIMFDVYIALAVLPEVFEYDKVSIENEIDLIIKNIVNAPLNLKQDTVSVLSELMQYSSIHNFGVKNGSIINSEKHEYLVLSNISTSIKFIEKLYTKNNNRLNEDTINDDIESMLTSFDLKNNVKVHKPNGKALNKLANGGYGVSNAVDKLISRIYAPAQTAPAQTAPAQTAPAQTAPAQTAPAQTAPAQTAPAQTPDKIEKPNHNENTRKIIGEAIAIYIIEHNGIYNDKGQDAIYWFYHEQFGVEYPEVSKKGIQVKDFCISLIKDVEKIIGTEVFNDNQNLDMQLFSETMVNHTINNDKSDKVGFEENRKKIGMDLLGKLRALNTIIKRNGNSNFLNSDDIANIIKNKLNDKAKKLEDKKQEKINTDNPELEKDNKKENILEKGFKKALNIMGIKKQ